MKDDDIIRILENYGGVKVSENYKGGARWIASMDIRSGHWGASREEAINSLYVQIYRTVSYTCTNLENRHNYNHEGNIGHLR